ncbi:unnamed protein product [Paramecium pentaurelia]|uniref:Uncharacterized protein n=1 Tax=Paramecium pentaurelia TaxID=43138 RepID=A0A8S1VFM8_9CILI|nr:unnamed protein product [Paramecium pentaurelia]
MINQDLTQPANHNKKSLIQPIELNKHKVCQHQNKIYFSTRQISPKKSANQKIQKLHKKIFKKQVKQKMQIHIRKYFQKQYFKMIKSMYIFLRNSTKKLKHEYQLKIKASENKQYKKQQTREFQSKYLQKAIKIKYNQKYLKVF